MSDCALASLAGSLGACAGRKGAGAPQDMAATSLHNAHRRIGQSVGYLSESDTGGTDKRVKWDRVWVSLMLKCKRKEDSREMGEG